MAADVAGVLESGGEGVPRPVRHNECQAGLPGRDGSGGGEILQRVAAVAADALQQFGVRMTGNKIVRFLIMTGINVRFVSVRRVSVGAWQKGQ